MGKIHIGMTAELIESMLTSGDVTRPIKRLWNTDGLPEGVRLIGVDYNHASRVIHYTFWHDSVEKDVALRPITHAEYVDA